MKIKEWFQANFKQSFTGPEVVERVFELLTKGNEGIIFPNNARAYSKIADDSDDHRIRRGYMEYRKIFLDKWKENNWALGLGNAFGDYPALPYGKDIIALKIPEDVTGRFGMDIHQNPNFKKSLIHSASTYGPHDGALTLVGPWMPQGDPWNEFGPEILERVGEHFYLQEPRDGDRGNLLMRLYPLNFSTGIVELNSHGKAKYNKSHINILKKGIEEVLTSPKV